MSFSLRVLALIAGVCLMASACGDDNDDERRVSGAASTATAMTTPNFNPESGAAEPTTNPDGASSTPGATTGTIPGQSVNDQPEEPPLVLTPVVSLPDPMALVARPGTGSERGDLYVAVRGGQVWLLTADDDEPPEIVLDIGDLTTTDCENGLLGIAFSPDGSKLYAHYTDLQGDSQIVEYPMIGQSVRGDQGQTVLSADQPACNHNGGHIALGPDGYLWIGLGDGGGANDMFNHGQNLDSLLATILRINPEAESEPDYAIPADNPFATGGGRPEIWVYGARNPWRFSFDRATGDLWIADVGQDEWEEIHVLSAADDWVPGANLGWPLFEGHERFSGTDTPDDLVFPFHIYHHDDGCSITGGYVYRGSAIPHLAGTYVFGDFCTGRIWGLTSDEQGVATRAELGVSVPGGTLVSFGEDAAGELYVLSFDGTVYRLDPAS